MRNRIELLMRVCHYCFYFASKNNNNQPSGINIIRYDDEVADTIKNWYTNSHYTLHLGLGYDFCPMIFIRIEPVARVWCLHCYFFNKCNQNYHYWLSQWHFYHKYSYYTTLIYNYGGGGGYCWLIMLRSREPVVIF